MYDFFKHQILRIRYKRRTTKEHQTNSNAFIQHLWFNVQFERELSKVSLTSPKNYPSSNDNGNGIICDRVRVWESEKEEEQEEEKT